ncbi:hypothetical protein [Nocardioides sp.]|uniref:hypothetical protein n=1 Tax=Nocardioides sp. TaxID=35761 RepID=UPI002BF3B240|nr:hypothetical protein [Nocardioides sp.]HXH80874.1 hypothetical protein [Nocardioides sp.]
MKPHIKHAMLTASLVLVGASAVGCGMGGPPSDASEKEFCTAVNSLFDDIDLAEEPSQKETVAAVKKWGKEMEKVGTPKGLSDEGRKGFEVMVEEMAKIEDDATAKELEEIDKDLSKSDNEAVDVFDDYMTETCSLEEPEAP